MLLRLSNEISGRVRGRLGAALLGLLVSACAPKPAPAEQVPDAPPVSEPPKPAPATAGGEGGEGQCKVDADCVPASCCHPASCVPAAQKPDCTDVMCTMQCAPNTLDCGGHCACEAGSCKAIFANL